VSISSVAVELAQRALGDLGERRVLVIGAGEMAELTARALAARGVATVFIANRRYDRAIGLAQRFGGEAVRIDELPEQLERADIIVSATNSPHHIVERDELEQVMASREGRPLLIVDIAVPRDIDPTVGQLPGVTLLDMDDLRAFAAVGATARAGEVQGVRTIIDNELERYLGASSAREVSPMIVALRDRAEQVRQAEVERYRSRLGELDPAQVEAVEALTHGIIGKLLHDPQLALKDAAGSARGDRLVAALRELFALEDDAASS
jgi:glutamyl-tRNA reductase